MFGNTALICAVKNSHHKCADLIINAGAHVNKEIAITDRVLSIAAWKGSSECAEILIKAGADVNSYNNLGTTALMFAAFKGYRKCVDLLIEAGADVNRGVTVTKLRLYGQRTVAELTVLIH